MLICMLGFIFKNGLAYPLHPVPTEGAVACFLSKPTAPFFIFTAPAPRLTPVLKMSLLTCAKGGLENKTDAVATAWSNYKYKSLDLTTIHAKGS